MYETIIVTKPNKHWCHSYPNIGIYVGVFTYCSTGMHSISAINLLSKTDWKQ